MRLHRLGTPVAYCTDASGRLSSGMNQREFTRVRTTIPLDCCFADGRKQSGTTNDVSLNGCYIAEGEMPPEDTPCTAVLYLDGREGAIQVRANAVVVRSRGRGFALHFTELVELDSYEHLRNLIRYNAEDPDQADHEFDSHLGLRRVDPTRPPPG